MDKIVIAFGNDNNRNRIAEILELNGLAPMKICKTGKEAICAVRAMGGGIVICAYKLVDMTADNLAYDIEDIAETIAVGQAPMLEMVGNEKVYKIASPIKKNELISTVKMLSEKHVAAHMQNGAKRTESEQKIIDSAKQLLMDRYRMTEPQAHRYIQKRSMDMGLRLISTARIIVNSFGK